MSRKLLNEELERKNLSQYREADKLPIVIILDNIRSLHNVGSVFRTSDSFLIEKLILCGITGTPPHREIEKSALGATESVEWSYEESTIEVVTQLKQKGYSIIAVEQTAGSTMLRDLRVNKAERLALIFGHEINGVSQEVVDICDKCVEIPQYGTKHSFNIAVTAGIVLWEIANKLGGK